MVYGGVRRRCGEDRVMAKKQSKREILTALVAELAKLRGEVKALGREIAAVSEQVRKLAPKPIKAVSPAAKRSTKDQTSAPTARKAGAAPKRPVLVSPSAGGAT
jgi:predicted  nucleic acid-binding Zn-ribbon protein